jgi:hypothetical protein
VTNYRGPWRRLKYGKSKDLFFGFLKQAIIRMGGREMVRIKSGLWVAILILISGATVLSPVIANAEYAYRKAITIDHTKVSATLTNFPILISISDDNDLKNHVTSVNGYDLVFKDGSGTKLAHELERWDGSTGSLVAWVKIPFLSSVTDTVIYMWYGDNGVTTSQENKKDEGSGLNNQRAQRRVAQTNGWKSRRGKSQSHVAWMAGGDGDVSF